ncbi:MAG: sulfatase-like hydrolase/transferase [Holophagales bacterium]|nr:sulfatase-like hydrolase/transferase [Holophagales bacterium]
MNVVLVSIDTLRADRLGCYGGTTVETPLAIDSLSNAGVRFQNAFTLFRSRCPRTGRS